MFRKLFNWFRSDNTITYHNADGTNTKTPKQYIYVDAYDQIVEVWYRDGTGTAVVGEEVVAILQRRVDEALSEIDLAVGMLDKIAAGELLEMMEYIN